jgi:scyllo-inositol 2-dehydrogenase (NAD+)
VAALGLGRLGAVHALNLARHVPGAELALVVDVDEQAAHAASEQWHVPFATDAGVAFDDPSIQAVEICTPSDTHADLIARAAHAGKAIFCEKPIALTLDDADRALAAVARAGVPLQMGFMRRHDAAFREAKRLIDEGAIGRPLTFRGASLDGSISPSRDFLARCGGIFVDVALHDFDMARWLIGDEIVEVSATGAVLMHEALREVHDVDNAFVHLRFARGAIGSVQVSHTAVYGYDIAAEVLGERGAVRAGDFRRTDLWRYDGAGRVSHDTIGGFVERFADAYLQELIAFIACVRAGGAPATTGADGRAALAVALAARRSLQQRRAVPLAEMT